MADGCKVLQLPDVGCYDSVLSEEYICDFVFEQITHGICVSNLVYMLAKELDLEEEVCYELSLAGILHDIGKIKLKSYLYGEDEETLTVEKLRYIRMHSKLGYDILVKHNFSDFILESVLYHHENYDGSGYPENLQGDNIPMGARIIRICDVFAALISDRAYRKAFDMDTAVELMIDEVKNFDMKFFLAFFRVIHNVNLNVLIGKEEKE